MNRAAYCCMARFTYFRMIAGIFVVRFPWAPIMDHSYFRNRAITTMTYFLACFLTVRRPVLPSVEAYGALYSMKNWHPRLPIVSHNAEFTGAPFLRVRWNDVLWVIYFFCLLLPVVRFFSVDCNAKLTLFVDLTQCWCGCRKSVF